MDAEASYARHCDAWAKFTLAQHLEDDGCVEEAESALRACVEAAAACGSSEAFLLSNACNTLAMLLQTSHKHAEAETFYVRSQ